MARVRKWTTLSQDSGNALNSEYTSDWTAIAPAGHSHYTLLRTLAMAHVWMPAPTGLPDPWGSFAFHGHLSLKIATVPNDAIPSGDWQYSPDTDFVLFSSLSVSGIGTKEPEPGIGYPGEYNLHWDLQPGAWDSKAQRASSVYPVTAWDLGRAVSGVAVPGFTATVVVRQLVEYEV